MESTHIVQIVTGSIVAALGFFLKRAFSQMDDLVGRIRGTELDCATLAAETRDLHSRLERIEDKIDRLLERGRE
mgnify:FL=1